MQLMIPSGCGNSFEHDAYSVSERSRMPREAAGQDTSSGVGPHCVGQSRRPSDLMLPKRASCTTALLPSEDETKMRRDFPQSSRVRLKGRALRSSHDDAALACNEKFTENQHSNANFAAATTKLFECAVSDRFDTARDQKEGPLEPGRLLPSNRGSSMESKALEDDIISEGSPRARQQAQKKRAQNWRRAPLGEEAEVAAAAAAAAAAGGGREAASTSTAQTNALLTLTGDSAKPSGKRATVTPGLRNDKETEYSVFVDNLKPDATASELARLLCTAGVPEPSDIYLPAHKRYGFIRFRREDDARRLLPLSGSIPAGGRPLLFKAADTCKDRPWHALLPRDRRQQHTEVSPTAKRQQVRQAAALTAEARRFLCSEEAAEDGGAVVVLEAPRRRDREAHRTQYHTDLRQEACLPTLGLLTPGRVTLGGVGDGASSDDLQRRLVEEGRLSCQERCDRRTPPDAVQGEVSFSPWNSLDDARPAASCPGLPPLSGCASLADGDCASPELQLASQVEGQAMQQQELEAKLLREQARLCETRQNAGTLQQADVGVQQAMPEVYQCNSGVMVLVPFMPAQLPVLPMAFVPQQSSPWPSQALGTCVQQAYVMVPMQMSLSHMPMQAQPPTVAPQPVGDPPPHPPQEFGQHHQQSSVLAPAQPRANVRQPIAQQSLQCPHGLWEHGQQSDVTVPAQPPMMSLQCSGGRSPQASEEVGSQQQPASSTSKLAKSAGRLSWADYFGEEDSLAALKEPGEDE
eukprot:TRINITY_DN23312_c0_g1_i1.p1 TRINITY_DN23312_c0_g1~~TRINITY_DN23312_c0_g1_i1.p1  ORF type:complete len:749 (-),score=129.92 TRINITY_DN23312_c0_g1_i1:422-2668(-)